MTFLSVIIPTYNSEKTIKKCLDSLLAQTFKDFEICIIDGGSLDNTLAIVSCCRTQFEDIRIISEPDEGIYDAMNRGIDFSFGEWLYFLGSDDEIFDQFVFSDILAFTTSKRCEIVYGNVYMKADKDGAGEIYAGLFDVYKLASQNICHQAIFYKKKLFKKFGKYKAEFPVRADWEMNLRLFPKVQFNYFDRVIANFYMGGVSSKGIADPFDHELVYIKKWLFKEYRVRKLFASLFSCFGAYRT